MNPSKLHWFFMGPSAYLHVFQFHAHITVTVTYCDILRHITYKDNVPKLQLVSNMFSRSCHTTSDHASPFSNRFFERTRAGRSVTLIEIGENGLF